MTCDDTAPGASMQGKRRSLHDSQPQVHDLDEMLARRNRYAERVDRVVAE